MFSWVTKRSLLSRRRSARASSSFFLLRRLFLSSRGRNWLSASRRRFNCRKNSTEYTVSERSYEVCVYLCVCNVCHVSCVLCVFTSSLRSSDSSAFLSSSFLMTALSSAIFNWNLRVSRSSWDWTHTYMKHTQRNTQTDFSSDINKCVAQRSWSDLPNRKTNKTRDWTTSPTRPETERLYQPGTKRLQHHQQQKLKISPTTLETERLQHSWMWIIIPSQSNAV